jgi:long-chain acyl-CoA synthetase
MSALLQTLHQIALMSPQRIALQGLHQEMSYGELDMAVAEAAHELNAQNFRALGLLADNGIPWALADLSALAASTPLVPLPLFFSPRQILHVVHDAGLDGLLTDRPAEITALLKDADLRCHIAGQLCGLSLIRLQGVAPRILPAGTAKITYTSGTTGEPKGVCLSLAQMETVAASLSGASEAQEEYRHLCLTPLSTLLENIGGIYTPLLSIASTCLLPLQHVGLRGASALDVGRMLQAMHDCAASSTILAPQMLHALVRAGEAGAPIPASLQFVAVGGAPVSSRLLQRAQQLGIPVFEGYGLSECASVVALNTPHANRSGSVGRPLPHVAVSFSAQGEILVNGSTFLGYLGQEKPVQPWPTGDLGYLDAKGFLHLTGRKKSLFITSYGRNVAPEWVERELTLHPAIAQAAVFGEGKPFNVAVIVVRPGSSRSDVEAALRLANRMLPDYARVSAWVAARSPFTPSNLQLTANGRLKRDTIQACYADAIENLYLEETNVVF